MKFLWPQSPAPSPTAFNRFGRVIHWAFTGMASILAVACIWSGIAELFSKSEFGPDYGAAIVAGFASVFFFLIGRAARYVMSGE